MSVAIVCASHTPLMYKGPASNETEQRVRTAFGRLGKFVKEFAPDYIIQFAPDHFNGFFYDMMPSFCVGAGAVSLGDWGGGTGPLDVPEKTEPRPYRAPARRRFRRRRILQNAGRPRLRSDVGSHAWRFQDDAHRPHIHQRDCPANSDVPPRQATRRIGRTFRRQIRPSRASRGLGRAFPRPSGPVDQGCASGYQGGLINGRNPSPEARKAREERVIEAGVLAEAGKGPCQPLNPDWDKEFMDMLRSGQICGPTRSTRQGPRGGRSRCQ